MDACRRQTSFNIPEIKTLDDEDKRNHGERNDRTSQGGIEDMFLPVPALTLACFGFFCSNGHIASFSFDNVS
jgi:hypothetical protein